VGTPEAKAKKQKAAGIDAENVTDVVGAARIV
jgi:hypothetical protein